jgi:hypothetical protein
MKFGDQVIYTENGKEFSATVLSVRALDHHLGANDEPLLQLGFFAPVLAADHKSEVSVIGTARQLELVQFRADVAHESHEFGAAAAEAKLTGIYPGGRWREVGPVELPPVVAVEGGAMELPDNSAGSGEPAVENQAQEVKPEGGEPGPTLQ